ncbi:MAG: FadR/GntR family transcriptional regulator [Anaerolineae bacterium]
MERSIFRPVRVTRASEEVVQQIKSLLFSGKLIPGDQLPSEKELAEQFGLSRTTVRDALRVLETQGLIEIKVGAGGGAFVAQPSTGPVLESLTNMLRLQRLGIQELVEARQIVETNIAMLAAQRATADDLKAMEQAIAAARAAHAADDPHFMPHSVAFHIALARAAKNQVLLFTVHSIRTLFYEVLEKLLPADDMAQRAIEDHQKILDAVKARDAERARRLMHEHLLYFKERAQKLDRST